MLPCLDLQTRLSFTIIAVFPVIPQLKEFAFPFPRILRPYSGQALFFPVKSVIRLVCASQGRRTPSPQYFSDSMLGRLFSLLRGLECLCQRLLVSTSKAPEHPPTHPIPPGLPALWLWRQTTLECVFVLFLVLFTSWWFERKVCLCSRIPFGRSLVCWCHYGVI